MAPRIEEDSIPSPLDALAGWKQRSAQFFCLLMVFGFPIFSVPCPKGTCTSPLEVVTTHAYVNELVSDEWMKGILYPASMMLNMEVLMGEEPQTFQLPEWNYILKAWNLTDKLKDAEEPSNDVEFSLMPNFLSMFQSGDAKRLGWEFVGACGVCLIGGLVSFARPNRMSFWGILLVLWYIFLEGGRREDVSAQPMFALALMCSLGWVNFKELFSFHREQEPAVAEVKSKVESKKTQ